MDAQAECGAKRPAAVSIDGFVGNRDFDFFYAGLATGRLLVQRCDGCGMLRNPPGPMCPSCRSTRWTAVDCDPRGVVYSYAVHHHPPLPGFHTPHTVVLVDMANGLRLLGGLERERDGEVRVGMPVTAHVVTDASMPIFRFALRSEPSAGQGRSA